VSGVERLAGIKKNQVERERSGSGRSVGARESRINGALSGIFAARASLRMYTLCTRLSRCSLSLSLRKLHSRIVNYKLSVTVGDHVQQLRSRLLL